MNLTHSPLLIGYAQSGHVLQCKTRFLKPQVRDAVLNALQQDANSKPVDVVEFHYPSGTWPMKLDQPRESNELWTWGHGESMTGRIRGLEQSVDDIFRYLEKNGPFLGVMGFSSGAAAGAIIASLLEKRHSIGNFQFNVSWGKYSWPGICPGGSMADFLSLRRTTPL